VTASLMFRRIKDGYWSATIRPGRSHVIVGLSPQGWKATLFSHDENGDLLVDDFGIFGSRQEAQDAASAALLGGR
jgi:hypothetical protein